jgi:23S rRNA pseudouridine1911/1915/1917 synthase
MDQAYQPQEDKELEAQEGSEELYERFSFRTDKGQEPLRIDKYLMNRIEGATRNKLQKAINLGMVLVSPCDPTTR